MLTLGQKIKVFGKDAIVLICTEAEVLIHTSTRCVKWVERVLVEI